MFNRILVPLDGSPLAERALPHASHFARIFGGSVVLLQVLDPSPYRDNAGVVEPLNWQIRKTEAGLYLKEVAERLREQGIPVEHILQEGRAAENIVDFAHNENFDLVILTTHGASGLSRWNISSVLSKVIDKIYLPVLVIRAYQSARDGQAEEAAPAHSDAPAEESFSVPRAEEPGSENLLAAQRSSAAQRPAVASVPVTSEDAGSVRAVPVSDGGIFYHRILIPIDSSRRAECSFPSGISLIEGEQKILQAESTNGTDTNRSTLVLAAVIKPPELPIPAPYPEELQQLSDRFMQISREAVREYLADIQARIPVKAETHILENESIPSAIHDLVDKENIDLVVFCAHGKTGRNNWPYGSVSRNYIEHGTQPVLVIQDVPLSQVRPTSAEIAAKKYGRR
ncbi:MAG: hypothetical protein EHM21_01280 [Chloroflexi bacterium]|nr:MAG: hypothetical protein EHM21_01280 [Chloroflexota bacterium]